MTALAAWLSGRSSRERLLLALLVLAGLPLALWLLLAEPLLAARDRARTDLAAARAQAEWVAARLAEAGSLPAPVPGPPPEGLAGLESRLATAGLGGGAARLADAGDGTVALALDLVAFDALMTWLQQVEAEAGYRLSALRLIPTAFPGAVAAEVRLEPAP